MNITDSNLPIKKKGIDPKLFLLWGFMVSSAMIFAGFTSAYIVRQADGGWLSFELPKLFYISTIIIFLSSATMQWAFTAAKNSNVTQIRLGLLITLSLGILFLFTQVNAYYSLGELGIYMDTNPSSSFLFVISLVHAIHIIAGIILLIATFVSSLKFKVHSKNLFRIKITTYFWHFLGALWIYLFLFFKFNG